MFGLGFDGARFVRICAQLVGEVVEYVTAVTLYMFVNHLGEKTRNDRTFVVERPHVDVLDFEFTQHLIRNEERVAPDSDLLDVPRHCVLQTLNNRLILATLEVQSPFENPSWWTMAPSCTRTNAHDPAPGSFFELQRLDPSV